MENLDKYCDIAKRMGERRMELAKEVDVSEYPLLFQYGAISRFNAGTKLKETNILKDGYSSMSLGYIGLDDLKFFDYIKEALDFDTFKIDIVKYLKAKCEERNSRDNIGWSVYSTPAESLCYKAAQAVNREEKTGRTRLTNSYHTDVTEKQTAFKKISREVPFQYIATGGYISFVELPDMSHNLDGIKSIVAFAEKEGMIYFELNLHLSQCFTCGSHTVEIQEGERTCLDCGEQDKTKLEVTRRTCGYLGTNRWNKGKTEEIAQRELHL
jgi:ribonucleoside-triphosphate reductase